MVVIFRMAVCFIFFWVGFSVLSLRGFREFREFSICLVLVLLKVFGF